MSTTRSVPSGPVTSNLPVNDWVSLRTRQRIAGPVQLARNGALERVGTAGITLTLDSFAPDYGVQYFGGQLRFEEDQVAGKAPPRKRKSNDPQEAMLRGLLTDPEGRSMVPTYTKKGTRRYAYYETRKDLAAKKGAAAPTRIAQPNIERHIISHLNTLLGDEYALRRMTNLEEASQLTALFDAARLRKLELQHPASRDETVRSLVASISLGATRMHVSINLVVLGSDGEAAIDLPLPERKPFREAKLRIENTAATDQIDRKLVSLIVEAMEARELVLASPELSLNQLGKREGRCRTQLGKLFRLSWLSPRVVEAIIDGRQPARLDRRHLLEANLPLCWHAQERMLGFAA